MTTYPALDLLSPEARAKIAERQAEHERWIDAMTEHFAKMVRAVPHRDSGNTAKNRAARRAMMVEFITGLESHFNERYRGKI